VAIESTARHRRQAIERSALLGQLAAVATRPPGAPLPQLHVVADPVRCAPACRCAASEAQEVRRCCRLRGLGVRDIWRYRCSAMKVIEAKQFVVDLITRDVGGSPLATALDRSSPDGDPGKLSLNGRVARAIHHFDGWYVPIELAWFSGSFDPPQINGGPFHWYVFAIPRRGRSARDHYFVCDYLQIRDWVLGFEAPLGRDHRDHRSWRADLRVLPDDPEERTGYFRWGDEPVGSIPKPSRVFELDNAATLSLAGLVPQRVGVFGPEGESSAHRQLKLYVAGHGLAFGMSDAARALVEHRFRTGDRVDVMFQNHEPERTVVEVEIAGEENICTGIHQAIKYRSLAEIEGGYELLSPTVRSLVVAYETSYPSAAALADRYKVELISVDPRDVLEAAM